MPRRQAGKLRRDQLSLQEGKKDEDVLLNSSWGETDLCDLVRKPLRTKSEQRIGVGEHALGGLDINDAESCDESENMSVTVGRKRTRNGRTDDSPERDISPSAPKKAIPGPHEFTGRETCTQPAPLSTDSFAQAERDRVNYSIKITKEMAASGEAPRPVRVYADGIYDMFHSGHARQLMQAKACFPNVYLIVGVCNDELTHRMKGRTVMNCKERYEGIRHCRYVDELVPDAPWTLDDEFLEKHKIDFVAHDDLPYGADGAEDIYKWLKDRGMFVATQRTEGISTTDVIARIIKDYDLYIRRNLARGYSAKELNVGFMKEKSIQFQEKMYSMKQKGKQVIEKVQDKRNELFQRWEERSRDFIGNFMELFGRDGRLVRSANQWLNRAITPPVDDPDYEDRSRSPSLDGHSPVPSPPIKRGRPSASAASEDDLGYEYESDEEERGEEEEEEEEERQLRK